MRRVGQTAILIGLLLLVPGLLIVAFERAAYDVEFHIDLHDALGSAERANITRDTMVDESEALISYIRGKRDDFPALTTLDGKPLVGETMEHHMVDVKTLFALAATVRKVCLIAGASLLLLGCALSGSHWVRQIKTGGLISIAFWLALLLFAAVYAILDFNSLFLRFHELIFTNDLWLLNPATDPIINMLSEEFFLGVAARAALMMLGAMAALAICVCAPSWHTRRRKK